MSITDWRSNNQGCSGTSCAERRRTPRSAVASRSTRWDVLEPQRPPQSPSEPERSPGKHTSQMIRCHPVGPSGHQLPEAISGSCTHPRQAPSLIEHSMALFAYLGHKMVILGNGVQAAHARKRRSRGSASNYGSWLDSLPAPA